MKFISWNVNGIRACVKKGWLDYFHAQDADFFCIQETKMQQGQLDLDLLGYHQYWNDAEKKGYSGTAIFTKHEPLSVHYGLEDDPDEAEGRIITLEYDNFYLVNTYIPNAKRDLSRLPYRLEWEDRMYSYLTLLNLTKPVIYTGDLNVAHQEIDIRNAKSNIGNSGFTFEEREKMTRLLENGFVDSFRYLYPEAEGHYTWWSYMAKVRERNIGWRIDYFIVSEKLAPFITEAGMHPETMGSDHCPIYLEIDKEIST
ncbi:exodeoxyribonuclease III [Chryseomicrobium palamuruense]|uniref:Exodeoxyribonuclease III n=1 Tax=Chryseomicrobium palamuruense TaxID=682973 RepID=A0ABV8UVC8_9BACL